MWKGRVNLVELVKEIIAESGVCFSSKSIHPPQINFPLLLLRLPNSIKQCCIILQDPRFLTSSSSRSDSSGEDFNNLRSHMDQNATIEEGDNRNALELVRSVSDKHLELLRPSSRYYSIFKGQATEAADREKGKYTLIRDEEDSQLGMYDKPLPCFGCGIGWFSFLVGFLCPLMWYYATILYFGNYYRKDFRERAGLAASAIAAMGFSVILIIVVLILLF